MFGMANWTCLAGHSLDRSAHRTVRIWWWAVGWTLSQLDSLRLLPLWPAPAISGWIPEVRLIPLCVSAFHAATAPLRRAFLELAPLLSRFTSSTRASGHSPSIPVQRPGRSAYEELEPHGLEQFAVRLRALLSLGAAEDRNIALAIVPYLFYAPITRHFSVFDALHAHLCALSQSLPLSHFSRWSGDMIVHARMIVSATIGTGL